MDQQQQSRQRPTRTQVAWIGIGAAILFVAVVVFGGYYFEWEWTGYPKRTPWDWVDLLIVPSVLALGGYLFTRSENLRTQRIADERRQDDTLQAYLDGMSQLLTDKDRPLHRSQRGDSLSSVARARTLTVLTRLDRVRKGSVLRFLYESGLINKDRLVVDLTGADLNGANLSRGKMIRTYLGETDLRGADLSRTDLSSADLHKTNLSGAALSGAGLNYADLRRTDLRGADLSGANMLRTDLMRTKLGGANLSRASLGGANLWGADLRGARGVANDELEKQASSLKGAIMPNGQKYEEWLKSKGRGEDGENSGP